MCGPASTRIRPRPERGGISWVTLVLLLMIGGSAYLGWVWVPLYFEHYTVKQVVADYMNQAVKNPDDADLRHKMVAKIASLDQFQSVDRWGRPVTTPAVQVDESAITWERDTGALSLHVAFEYERQVVYPFIDRVAVTTFRIDRTGTLTVPDWGPAR